MRPSRTTEPSAAPESGELERRIRSLITDADAELSQAKSWERSNNEWALGILIGLAAAAVLLGVALSKTSLAILCGTGGLLGALGVKAATHSRRAAQLQKIKRKAANLLARLRGKEISREHAWGELNELEEDMGQLPGTPLVAQQ